MIGEITKLRFFSAILAAGIVSGCARSNFQGGNGTKPKIQLRPCPAGQCNELPGSGLPGSTPEPIVPKACNAQTLVPVAAGGTCPDDYAVFGIDDPTSRQTAGHLACCPLPAGDILTGGIELRPGGTCSTNEVLVGNEILDNQISNAKCRAINTNSYKLSSAGVDVCYFGDASTGRGNAPRCSSKGSIPDAFFAITDPKASMMGEDGCLNFPWGSLSVAQTGRNCDTQRAMQLQKIDGTPVKMFE
ncbi:MAG: hypothetical protein RIQ81_1868 [Pseudomonadota bacterium]|jgi:hypothetical protein